MAASASPPHLPVSIRRVQGSETDSFVFQIQNGVSSETLADFASKCGVRSINIILVNTLRDKHVVAVFPVPTHKSNANKTLLKVAKDSRMVVNSDFQPLDLFHAEMFGWEELPAHPDLHKSLPEDDDNFDPHRDENDCDDSDIERCARAEQEALSAKERVEELMRAGGISEEENEDTLAIVGPLVLPETSIMTALVVCGDELCERHASTGACRTKPDKFNSREEYSQWLVDVPAKRLQNKALMLSRPSHVTVVDALRMLPDRRLLWVLFRLQEAGLAVQPTVEHFPPFYKVICSTMERGAPHAKFDLAKKLFVKWAVQQQPNFALPGGRIESWPADLRCKVQSVSKGKEVKLCPCGRVTEDGPFCGDACKFGRCKTCAGVLQLSAVGPLAELPRDLYVEVWDVHHKISMLRALQEKDLEGWRQDCLDRQNNCLECSEFEANHFIKRERCKNINCYFRLESCDECVEFERFYWVAKQKCDMCSFHLHEEFLENLRRFSLDSCKYSLVELQARRIILESECMPKRLDVLVCPTCPRPAKRQRVLAVDAASLDKLYGELS